MEYRLCQESGVIYTEEDYFREKICLAVEPNVINTRWLALPIVDNPTDEVRETLHFIYSKPFHSLNVGDIIKKDLSERGGAIVEECKGDKLMVQDILTHLIYEWEGPFLKLASCSLVDHITAYQIAYNIAMNKLAK